MVVGLRRGGGRSSDRVAGRCVRPHRGRARAVRGLPFRALPAGRCPVAAGGRGGLAADDTRCRGRVDGVGPRAATGTAPELVRTAWAVVRDGVDTPIEEIAEGRAWPLCEALLVLHTVADEACAGMGVAVDDPRDDGVRRARPRPRAARPYRVDGAGRTTRRAGAAQGAHPGRRDLAAISVALRLRARPRCRRGVAQGPGPAPGPRSASPAGQRLAVAVAVADPRPRLPAAGRLDPTRGS